MGPFRKLATPDGRWGIVDAHNVQVALVASEWMADAILRSPDPPSPRDQKLLENIAAISAEFHADQRAYVKFYDDNADGLGGFSGIWRLMIDAGVAFRNAEPEDWESTTLARDYLDAILLFAQRLHAGSVALERRSLERLAHECIYLGDAAVLE